MKALGIFFFLLFFGKLSGFCQNIEAVELCNKTQRLGYFSSASNSINFYLLAQNKLALSGVHISAGSKLDSNYLHMLSRTFDSVASRYKMKELPSHANVNVNLGPGLWHETNYFYVDKKSKKKIQVMQVLVLFEGDNADTEKRDPRVKDVVIRTGKSIISRQAFLTGQSQP